MPDLIVSTLNLPATPAIPDDCRMEPAQSWDRDVILGWVREHFHSGWASEVANGLSHHPSRVLVVRKDTTLLGFACFDVTFPGFFGPTGVAEQARGLGLGKALLIESLHRLNRLGYVYAFIGDAGPVEFYRKTVGAEPLPESLASAYTPPLQRG